jgi:hypothetical protein
MLRLRLRMCGEGAYRSDWFVQISEILQGVILGPSRQDEEIYR